MYVPKHFEERDVGVLHQLVRTHPLGALVTLTQNGLDANHIPFLVQSDPAPYGTLHGHIARANPLWRDFSPNVQALVIFQGPQTFISPSWYPSKKETAKVVPTWNYVVVHAHGHLRVIDDPIWVRAHLEQLTNRHEAEHPVPWKVTDSPADYLEKMVGAIVGLEIPIAQLVGKWKVSQNRSARDREGVIEALIRENSGPAAEMARLVQQAHPAA
jgi:transcriptional regulator